MTPTTQDFKRMSTYHTNHIPHKRGAAIITAVLFFVVISMAMAIGLSSPVVREYTTSRDFAKSKGAYYLSEAGSEDAIYRIKKAKTIGAQEVISLGGNTATTTITDVDASKKSVGSLGDILFNTRRVSSTLTTSSGASFSYGVQAGDGGVFMSNSSSITGNLYSSGPVCGGGKTLANCLSGTAGTDNTISGTVLVATTTANGVIDNIANQGTASMYANKIYSSVIASTTVTCNTISGSNRSSCSYPFGTQTPAELPIPRSQIDSWEAAATAGGVIPQSSCTLDDGKYRYEISSSQNLGPIEIQCGLKITGAGSGSGPTITLMGPVWVKGDIKIKNKMTVQVDPSLAGQGKSMVMIADKPTDRLNSSKIEVEDNNPVFAGAGTNSWVMLLSENSGASQGDPNEAIQVKNGAGGELLLYARLGDILLQGTASVREVTGYKITLENSANVIYASGLQNSLFTSGPGGSWTIQDWKEGQ
ncbi:MAG: hypothetical protein HZB12_00855 [Candidatus Yonathbacteria bacterium]|nr:hypothetical protein [Candidatus Yonathbacteria bacterium]